MSGFVCGEQRGIDRNPAVGARVPHAYPHQLERSTHSSREIFGLFDEEPSDFGAHYARTKQRDLDRLRAHLDLLKSHW